MEPESERQLAILKSKIKHLEVDLVAAKKTILQQSQQIHSLNQMVSASNEFCLRLEHSVQGLASMISNLDH